MPRVKKYTDPREDALKDELGVIVFRIGRTELAKRTGIPYSTLCHRLNKLGTLTMDEYWRIMAVAEKGR